MSLSLALEFLYSWYTTSDLQVRRKKVSVCSILHTVFLRRPHIVGNVPIPVLLEKSPARLPLELLLPLLDGLPMTSLLLAGPTSNLEELVPI